MASLSLPKVLHSRRLNSLDQDRENFEKFQVISLNKAVSVQECPVKEKHVRSAIIGTYQEKGAPTFWMCASRLPIQDNPIVGWKFCHVMHKVLREGHQHVILDSQKYRSKMYDLGRLWGHLKEGYGKLILCYCQLIIQKLDFHRGNPHFPGNLQVSDEGLERIGENDVNIFLLMCIDLFDYMDAILVLQSTVFNSLDMSRSNSMTSAGQCRLAPLILCIQDSSLLYDYCVKLLFRLHSTLPPDTLSGHRERFVKQFRSLRDFYHTSSNLQYFRTLIQVPMLPENPPNFLIASELSTHVTPVVILPPETEDLDISDSGSAELVDLNEAVNGNVSPDLLLEKDRYISQLLQEIDRLKSEIFFIRRESHDAVLSLQERIGMLERQLAERETDVQGERSQREDIALQLAAYQQKEKASIKAEEAEIKASEEKFKKLKGIYQTLRDEHVTLLRQKADLEKQLLSTKQLSEDTQKAKEEIDTKFLTMVEEKRMREEALQQASNEREGRIMELQATQQEIDEAKAEFTAQVADLKSQLSSVTEEREDLKSQLVDKCCLLEDNQQLKSTLELNLAELTEQNVKLKVELDQEKANSNIMEKMLRGQMEQNRKKLIEGAFVECEGVLKWSLNELDNPASSGITCTAEYLATLAKPLLINVALFKKNFEAYQKDTSNHDSFEHLMLGLSNLSHITSLFMLQGKGTAQTAPDIEKGDLLLVSCRNIGNSCINVFRHARNHPVSVDCNSVNKSIQSAMDVVNWLLNKAKGNASENIGDLIETEMASMDQAIEEAAKRIQEMLRKSHEGDTGIKLEVNGKILDACTHLMQAVRQLVQKGKALQIEIVGQGKGTASEKEFYKRNHQWTEGLLSAAKAVGMGAKFLVDTADKILSGEAKFEQLMVACQEIAASTAQLVVASRVKADSGSICLQQLSSASKVVTQATGNVVATSKDCIQMVEETETLDYSNLSLHQTKRLEMESQVKVLEYEAALEKERQRLAYLRKQHYRLGGENEGWGN